MAGNYSDTTNIVDTQQIDAADVKTPIDALDDAIYDALHGETPQFNQLRFEADTTVTIDSVTEAITISQTYHKVANFGGAGSDNLKDILGYNEGDFLILQPANTGNITVVQHDGGGSGNIRLANKQDFYLTGQRMLVLMSDGTNWHQIGIDYGQQNPRFDVIKSGTQGLTTGVAAKVTWETENDDTGGYFDLATERFTPLLAGIYLFTGVVRITGVTSGDLAYIQYRKNGTVAAEKIAHASVAAGASANLAWWDYFNGSTDYVELFALSDATTPVIQNAADDTFWKGILINGIEES